jgi:CHAD domain-containing protein
MSYLIPLQSDLSAAVRKIIITGLKEALSILSISRGLDQEQFKKARKALKKVRGMLHLVRDSIDNEKFLEEEKNLKDLSRVFRDVRDAIVIGEALEKARKLTKDDFDAKEFKDVKSALLTYGEKTIEKVFENEKDLRTAIADLQAAIERIPELKIKDTIWDSIEQGLKSAYRDCFEYFQLCDDSNKKEDWIKWRKYCNFLVVELDFFSEFLSSELKTWHQGLHSLSEILGTHQDLILVEEKTKELKNQLESVQSGRNFLDRSAEIRDKLRKEARKNAARLFVKSPKEFVKKIITSTREWRKAC